MNAFFISLIRTITPVVIGLILAGLAKLGLGVDEAASTALNAGLDAFFIGGYYAAARWLEARWPSLGLLLGSTSQPTYAEPYAPHRVRPDDA